MDAAITWGIRLAVLALILGALTGGWYKVNGWCNGACEKERAQLVKLTADIATERAARARLIKEQEARDAQHADDLRKIDTAYEAERKAYAQKILELGVRRDAVARELEGMRGRCVLPSAARILWNDTAAAGAPAAPQLRPAAPDPAAPDAPAARDGRGVDCVDAYNVGRENTEAGKFNGDEVNRCWGYAIPLWEACTGKTFDRRNSAPWLIQGVTP